MPAENTKKGYDDIDTYVKDIKENGVVVDKVDLPDGEYFGIQSGYHLRLVVGDKVEEVKTKNGIRGPYTTSSFNKFRAKDGKLFPEDYYVKDPPGIDGALKKKLVMRELPDEIIYGLRNAKDAATKEELNNSHTKTMNNTNLVKKAASDHLSENQDILDLRKRMILGDLVYPFSSARAGRASAFADSTGQDVPYRVRRPVLSTFSDATIGGLAGLLGVTGYGIAADRLPGLGLPSLSHSNFGKALALGAGGGTLLGMLLSAFRRRSQMKDIMSGQNREAAEIDLEKLGDKKYGFLKGAILPYAGPHRVGYAEGLRSLLGEKKRTGGNFLRVSELITTPALASAGVSLVPGLALGAGNNLLADDYYDKLSSPANKTTGNTALVKKAALMSVLDPESAEKLSMLQELQAYVDEEKRLRGEYGGRYPSSPNYDFVGETVARKEDPVSFRNHRNTASRQRAKLIGALLGTGAGAASGLALSTLAMDKSPILGLPKKDQLWKGLLGLAAGAGLGGFAGYGMGGAIDSASLASANRKGIDRATGLPFEVLAAADNINRFSKTASVGGMSAANPYGFRKSAGYDDVSQGFTNLLDKYGPSNPGEWGSVVGSGVAATGGRLGTLAAALGAAVPWLQRYGAEGKDTFDFSDPNTTRTALYSALPILTRIGSGLLSRPTPRYY